jgi:hypothetical protein
VTARGEYRDATNEVSHLGELGMTYKLSRDLSVLLKGRYFDDKQSETGSRSTYRGFLGLAYRPAWTDAFNGFAKMEYKHDKNPSDTSGQASDSYIVSMEGVYQATDRLQLTGKYAGKLTKTDNIVPYTDLFSARFIYDITDRWDLGLTCRMLTGYMAGTRLYGGSAEVGYRIIKNVWLSVGYSLDKFDSDLTQDDYSGRGPFVKLRVKVDENTFKFRKKPVK